MNFGNAYRTRYRLLLLLLFSTLAQAQTWSEHLKSNIEIQKANLEKQMMLCKSYKSDLPKITKEWFIKLTKDEKYALASYISYEIDMRCFGEQQAKYESAIIAYTSETGNSKMLNEWLEFSKVYRSSIFNEVFDKVDVSAALEWLNQNPDIKSFDKVIFLEQYPEFKK